MEKTGFIYLWYDKRRKMYYIGCHWGTVDDRYICSSNRMRDAYRRRPQDFKRRILKTGIERTYLLEEEYKWLSLIKKEELGRKYYNVSKRHFGHWSTTEDKSGKNHPFYGKTHSLETRQKISAAQIGKKRGPHSEKHRKKLSEAKIGKAFSDEHKKKLSEARRGKVPWNKGKTYKSKSPSEETRRKISEAQIGKFVSEETRRKQSEARKRYLSKNAELHL